MKKLFMFLAVAGLATFGASCSKSDDNGGKDPVDPVVPGKEKTLALTGLTTVETEAAVTYTVKSEGKVVDGAEIYVNDAKQDNPVVFSKAGSYKVIAKKSGFKDSNVLSVTVTEKKVIRKAKLTVEQSTITMPAAAIIHVKYEDDGSYAPNVEILINGSSIGSLDDVKAAIKLTFKNGGEYVVAAVVDGVETNSVDITVNELKLVGNGSFTFDGKTYNSTSAKTVFDGFYYTDKTKTALMSGWMEIVYANDNSVAAQVLYFTPAIKNAKGEDEPTFPTATNVIRTEYAVLFSGKDGSVILEDDEDKVVTTTFANFTLSNTGVVKGDFSSTGTANAKPFTISFTGEHRFSVNEEKSKGINKIGINVKPVVKNTFNKVVSNIAVISAL